MVDRTAARSAPARPGGRRTRAAAAKLASTGGVLLAAGLLLMGLLMLPGTGSAADPPTPAAPAASTSPAAGAAAAASTAASASPASGPAGATAPGPVVVPTLPNANHIPAPGLIPQVLPQPPRWVPLAEDGVHDPRGPAVTLLQEPGEALAGLPPDSTGNQVRWVQALDQGAITPRASILPGTPVRVRDQDLIIARNGSMPAVKFPHRQHTLWLDCSNCHPYPFKDKLGANRLSMVAILNGEQCGLCHGAVSFPLTECNRCHSVPNNTLRAIEAAAAASRAAAATTAASAPAAGGQP